VGLSGSETQAALGRFIAARTDAHQVAVNRMEALTGGTAK